MIHAHRCNKHGLLAILRAANDLPDFQVHGSCLNSCSLEMIHQVPLLALRSNLHDLLPSDLLLLRGHWQIVLIALLKSNLQKLTARGSIVNFGSKSTVPQCCAKQAQVSLMLNGWNASV